MSRYFERCGKCGKKGQEHADPIGALLGCDSVGWEHITEDLPHVHLVWVCSDCAEKWRTHDETQKALL
jgi:hypothetical protein